MRGAQRPPTEQAGHQVQRNKGPNCSSRALVQHAVARVLGGDNECHETQVIFVPEGIMRAGGFSGLAR